MTLALSVSACSTVPDPSACDKGQNLSLGQSDDSNFLNVDYRVPCDQPKPINI